MKTIVNHNELGEITFRESFWTGRKSVLINGTELKKVSKQTFVTADGREISIEGNFMRGSHARIGDEVYQLTPSAKWYEYVLSVIPFVFVMIWGNIPFLCEIVPIVGGAIGGLISGAFVVIGLFVMKSVRPIWLKIVVALLNFGVTFLLCYLVALAILSVMA